MAGDWIKMRTNLDTDPRVCEIADRLQIPELQVVGCLWKLWSWADEHTVDGNAVSVTKVTLDRFCGVTGFAQALANVGWLDGIDRSLTFPRFSEHNGQTAKTRALTAKRVAKHKILAPVKGNAEVTMGALPREEKRREDIKKRNKHDSEEFSETWNRWKQHRIEKQKPLGAIEEDSQLMDLWRVPESEAIEIVEFSIRAGALNLIKNGDHKPRERNGHSGAKKPSRLDVAMSKFMERS